jgi:hypothetical protein
MHRLPHAADRDNYRGRESPRSHVQIRNARDDGEVRNC